MASRLKHGAGSNKSFEAEHAARRKRSTDLDQRGPLAVGKEEKPALSNQAATMKRSRSRSASSSASSESSSSSSSSSGSDSGSSSSSSSGSSNDSSRSGSKKEPLKTKAVLEKPKGTESSTSKKKHSDSEIKKETAAATKVFVSRLTANVTKDHVTEIFGKFGRVKDVFMPMNSENPHLSRLVAKVEYEEADEASKAMKYMNGGQIDGQAIVVESNDENWGRENRGPAGIRRGASFGNTGAGASRRRSPVRSSRRSRSRSPRAQR